MQRTRRSARIAAALGLALSLAARAAFPDAAEPGEDRPRAAGPIERAPLGSPLFAAPGARDGMPDSSALCIAQDSQGFLWLGTDAGLVRYDGRAFKLLAHLPFDPNSLPEGPVLAIRAERGAIWVGTAEGLSRLDLAAERFAPVAEEPGLPGSPPPGPVLSIARDGRGNLWAARAEGLDRLDEATGRLRRYRHDPAKPASLPAGRARVLKADARGRLWVGGEGLGLVLYDPDRDAFIPRGGPFAPGAADEVSCIDEDASGRLWLGRGSGIVTIYDPATGRFEDRLPRGDRVRSICASPEGAIYVGTAGGGLAALSEASGRVRRFRRSGVPGSLVHDDVAALFRDREGDLWIGTAGGGICLLGRSSGGGESIAAAEGGMPAGGVEAALADRAGRLWVGLDGGTVAMRDPRTGAWRRYGRGSGLPDSPPGEAVAFVREDGRGAIWAGLGGGLARYDAASDRFVAASIPGEALGTATAMSEDPSGGFWIGTRRSGLAHWDPASGKVLRYRSDAVTALGRDSAGRLWVGTEGGLDRLEAEGGRARFVRYRYDPALPGGISSDSIRAILPDSRGILWIGTGGGGLLRYEPETDSFAAYTDRDGLPDNAVRSVLEDASGDLWIATRSGIASYDRSAGLFRRVSSGGGAATERYRSGACSAPDGTLFFGSVDRIQRIDPEGFQFDDARPPVVLLSASSRGAGARGAAALAALGRLDLPPGAGDVGFEFAALDFGEGLRSLYTYRLEGFDEEWSPPGRLRRAAYTNLPGGDYVFRVKASNGDGLWNEEGLSLKLRVRRRPWASPLALVAYALLLAGGGYVVARAAMGASLSSLGAEVERLRQKLVAASAAIESAAIVDPLTGLPNKRKIVEHLELAISRAAQSKLDVAVLMIDIDHFKSYNDRFGRAVGDECLKSVARAISACVRRSSDVVARYGGEEFLVVMEKTSVVGALSEAEAIRRAVEALGAVTASVGCVSAEPETGSTPASLVAAAEKALMAAKMLGRNRTSV